MDALKQTFIFSGCLLIVTGAFRFYAVTSAGIDIQPAGFVLYLLLVSLIGAFGFHLGFLKTQIPLAPKFLALLALFVFFMSHALSNLLGLYQISLFAYLGTVFIFGFLAALRGPAIFKIKKSE